MKREIEINEILKNFYEISGIRISIHDTEFNELYSYPAEISPFCKSVQQNAEVFKTCKNNDKTAFKYVKETEEVYIYRCHCGLYEAAAPIYHYGILSGYLMMGQIRDNDPHALEHIIKKSTEILGNEHQAVDISNSIKSIDRGLIYSYINIMSVLAEYITASNKLFNYNDKLPQLIMEYITKNYSSKITLSQLAQKFGCCNSTLTQCFKKEYNTSIMSYICELRLKKAEELLRKTRKSLKEISYQCGFYDQNYFSKSFAKKHGCSPSAYRSQNQ